MVLRQIGNVTSLELSLALVRAVELTPLTRLRVRSLPVESVLLVVTCVLVQLAHIVGHVDASGAQKACGFVQSRVWIGCCLRVGHLSGIELLTDLGLSPLEGCASGVLVAAALSPHLHVLLVVKLSHDGGALGDAGDDLGLMKTYAMVVLHLF